jgi:hypothetical protein
MRRTISSNIHLRVALAVALFISIFIAPWWATVGIALIFTSLYTPYEVIAAGLLFDILYPAPTVIAGLSLLFFMGALLLFILQFFIKKFIIFYYVR